MILLTWTLPLLQLVVSLTLVLTSINVVDGAPATTGVDVIEIPDGQIQNPITTESGTSLFKATDIAGNEIFYVGSVGQNALGSTTTDLFGTVKPVTTTNSAGSIITGLAEASATQGGVASIIPASDIPTLSSTPPSFAFTTVDANSHTVIDLGQVLTWGDGSTLTAVLMSGITTSCHTTVNSQGSTISETFGLFTRSNGTVVTNTLSFATDSSSLALSMPVAGTVSPVDQITTRHQNPVTEASGTSTGSTAASMTGIARSFEPVMSADSSSGNSNSYQNFQNSELPTPNRTSSPTSAITLRATANHTNSISLSQSLQSSGAYAALPTPAFPSVSFKGQSTARTISASPSAQSALLRSPLPSGSAPTLGLLTAGETTTIAGKSGMSLEGQAPLSSSSIAGSNTTNNTAGGGLYPVAKSDAPLAESLTGALLGQQVATITTIPPGMSLESIITKTKCSHAFAMVSTTISGSTVTTFASKLCHDDAAFLLLAGSTIPLLCTKVLSFLGFLLRWLCDPKTGALIAVDDITPPDPDNASGGGSTGDSTPDPNDDPESEDEKPTNSRDSSDRASSTNFPSKSRPSSTMTSSTNLPSTSRPTSTMTSSASSAVFNPLYIYSGIGGQDQLSELIGDMNPPYKPLQPAVGSTPMSGADWANINLTTNEEAVINSNPNVILVAPYISSLIESTSVTGSEVSTTAYFSTLSSYPSTTLSTLPTSSASSEPLFPSGVSKAKIRRHLPSDQTREKDFLSREHNGTRSVVLSKRDPGFDIIAQYGSNNQPCPRDLAVISWAPEVPAVRDYPYIYRQSKGENTWVFLVSTGIDGGHVVSRKVVNFSFMCEE